MKTSSERILHTDNSIRTAGFFKSLYIHVPFCKNICDYCALYSVVNNKSSVRNRYLDKIEIDLLEGKNKLLPLTSIFIGGGTPSQLTNEELTRLLETVNQHCSFEDDYEFTVECNPSSITLEKLAIMKRLGVNRLSFGAQSTTRETRHTLGRRTSEKQFFDAIKMARDTGFNNLNADLIYAVPGQTMEDWIEDIEKIKSLNLPHISAYSLILEEDTVMSEKFNEVNDELAVEMYKKAAELLGTQDTFRYEISNYSKSGYECRHNYYIWKGMTYLGIGPAAASFDGEKRWTQIRDLSAWLEGASAEVDDIPVENRIAEVVAFGFRTTKGWRVEELENLYGLNALEMFEDQFNELQNEGLTELNNGFIHPTEKGLLFADDIAETFLLL